MPKPRLIFLTVLLVAASTLANAQEANAIHPGVLPYMPSRIDWLTTVLAANLNSDQLRGDGYMLQIAMAGPETVEIYVRYLPTVNREAMNVAIDAARSVINTTAKSYGWQDWVKITESVQMAKRP
jgi:hypothetical protein